MKETTIKEVLLMLEHQTEMDWMDRCVFGYTHKELLYEIVRDIEK